MTNTIKLTVKNYADNYGGIDLIIDGRQCSIGSVVGYALHNGEDPVAAVLRTQEKMQKRPYDGHKMVWINLSSVTMCADKGFYEAEAAKRAEMPNLNTGDVIEFEGNKYEIVPANNRNFGLKKI